MTYKEWEHSGGKKVVGTSSLSEVVFDFIPKGGRVLDLGCGNGRISKIIQARKFETYGMDVNAEAIASAQADPELTNVKFSVQDATATNFEDEFFDAVVEQAVLACMERAERSLVLSEVHRILKPGGIFSIAEFGIREDLKERYEKEALITGEYHTVIVRGSADESESFRSHHFSQEELEALMQNTGFEIVYSVHPYFTTRSGNQHPSHQYILKKI